MARISGPTEFDIVIAQIVFVEHLLNSKGSGKTHLRIKTAILQSHTTFAKGPSVNITLAMTRLAYTGCSCGKMPSEHV